MKISETTKRAVKAILLLLVSLASIAAAFYIDYRLVATNDTALTLLAWPATIPFAVVSLKSFIKMEDILEKKS